MTCTVRFEDVSKCYRGAGVRYASLRDDLARLGRKAMSRFQDKAGGRPETKALDHVSFEVHEGEAFALVGPNGAGKTTALKLMARISYPSGGRIRVRGRVAALIEVGSGIHPELTGRENIWLYGRIMGVPKREVRRRFDGIVAFAELEEVIDRPVKTYSTGMQLRLGFSVASHLDAEIFIVDEALAVGDAAFQAKCTERMMGLVAEGRTLLFVSHQLTAVESICARGLFLLNGQIAEIGGIKDVLRTYLNWADQRRLEQFHIPDGDPNSEELVRVAGVSFHDARGRERNEFAHDEPVEIRVRFQTKMPIRSPHINVGITDGRPQMLIVCSTLHRGRSPDCVSGDWTAACRIERLHLMPRLYRVWCDVYTRHGHVGALCDWQEVGRFRIVGAGAEIATAGKSAVTLEALHGAIRTDYHWTYAMGNGVGSACKQVESAAATWKQPQR